MKTNIALLLFSILIMHSLNAQEVEAPSTNFDPAYASVKPTSPDVASLGQFVDLPVNPFNGLAEISVPLYTIDFEGISVPVNISYHSIGIKVTQEASRVGLGWALNAGGVITQTVQGLCDDCDLSSTNLIGEYFETDEEDYPVIEFSGDFYTGGSYSYSLDDEVEDFMEDHSYMGFYADMDYTAPSTAPLDETYFPDIEMRELSEKSDGIYKHDLQPDIFSFNFLGYSGKFIYDREGNTHIIDQQNIHFEKSDEDTWIAKTFDGFEFYFTKGETSRIYSAADISSRSFFLKKIIAPSGKYITFQYSSISYTGKKHLSQDLIYQFYYNTNDLDCQYQKTNSPYFNNHRYNPVISTKRLTEITFPGGVIDFSYSKDRTDINDPYRLSTITVANSQNTIHSISFDNNDYFGSSSDTKRLKLNSVSVDDKTYSFEYNEENEMPPTYSYNRDYWGFYNGEDNDNIEHDALTTGILIPNNQRFPWEGIPKPILSLENIASTGIVPLFANRRPDATLLQTYILNKITYPTGVEMSLTYEMNSYDAYDIEESLNADDKPGTGGGLRVGKIDKYDPITGKTHTVNYSYSGGVLFMPPHFTRAVYFDQQTKIQNKYSTTIAQKLMYKGGLYSILGESKIQDYLVSIGGLVGYENVTISDGYKSTYLTYHVEKPEFEKTLYDVLSLYDDDATHSIVSRPKSIPLDLSPLTGKLVEKSVRTGDIGIDTEYEWDAAPIYQSWPVCQESLSPSDYINGNFGFMYAIRCCKSVLLSKEEKTYTSSGRKTIYTTYSYKESDLFDQNSMLLRETKVGIVEPTVLLGGETEGGGDISHTKLLYPMDFASDGNVYELMNDKMPATVIETQNYVDDILTKSTKTAYKAFDVDLAYTTAYLPHYVILYYKEKEKARHPIYFTKYDKLGNLIETRDEQRLYTSYIYGYDGAPVIVAEIQNARTNDSGTGNEVGYCGFECPDVEEADIVNNYWYLYTGNSFSTSAHTGEHSRLISEEYGPTRVFSPDDQDDAYVFSAWIKTDSDFETGAGKLIISVNDPESGDILGWFAKNITATDGEWVYYSKSIDLSEYSQDVTLGCFIRNYSVSDDYSGTAEDILVDDICFRPRDNTMMQYYTHEPYVGVTSVTDHNRITQYYEYDDNGRLRAVKNNDKNLLKLIDYHYYNED